MCTRNYDQMINGSLDMVYDGRTDRRMEKVTEKVPHLKTKPHFTVQSHPALDYFFQTINPFFQKEMS